MQMWWNSRLQETLAAVKFWLSTMRCNSSHFLSRPTSTQFGWTGCAHNLPLEQSTGLSYHQFTPRSISSAKTSPDVGTYASPRSSCFTLSETWSGSSSLGMWLPRLEQRRGAVPLGTRKRLREVQKDDRSNPEYQAGVSQTGTLFCALLSLRLWHIEVAVHDITSWRKRLTCTCRDIGEIAVRWSKDDVHAVL